MFQKVSTMNLLVEDFTSKAQGILEANEKASKLEQDKIDKAQEAKAKADKEVSVATNFINNFKNLLTPQSQPDTISGEDKE